MGRTSGKEPKKKKGRNAARSRPTKGSNKFSVHHADRRFVVPVHQTSLGGNPTAYIYGQQGIDAKKKKKKRSGDKKRAAAKPFGGGRKGQQRPVSNFAARKGNKRGKRLFIARFPVVDTRTKAVPWFDDSKRCGSRKQNQQQQQQQRPPKQLLNGAFSVDAAAMDRLTAELDAFAAYVRLTPTEERSRDHLVQRIRSSCQRLFGVDPDQCQVFGSFAARPVCIFESDIDMAIWGVVEPDHDDENVNSNSSDDRRPTAEGRPNQRADGEDADVGTGETDAAASNRKKQDRILKWKALIDNATKSMEGSGDDKQPTEVTAEDTGESSEPVAPFEGSSSSSSSSTTLAAEDDTGEPSLFVLDRIGDDSAGLDGLDGGDTRSPNDGGGDDDREKPLAVEDNKDDNGVDDDDSVSASSQSDSADKLEGFWSRRRCRDEASSTPGNETGTASNPIALLDDDTGSKSNPVVIIDRTRKGDDDSYDSANEEKIDLNFVPKRRPRGQSLVSLSSSTTCSVEAKMDESGMEVSFVVDPTEPASPRARPGPNGHTKTLVVNALYKLARTLRPVATNLHVRKKARVPIINMVTHFGFECDIALGGHNGTDTSSYAWTQLSRFQSFASLVVFLKVLLNHQGLDKPFTGGLGSYSLYVLVASHIEQHLAMGGKDDPAEVLYTFFFRYGGVKHSNSKISSSCRTHLSRDVVVRTEDGGRADMKPCFQIENCITVFEACWRMLQKRVVRGGNADPRFSVLKYMVDASKLRQGRTECRKRAESKLREVLGDRSHAAAPHAGFPRAAETVAKRDAPRDREARELIEGYGQNVERFLPVDVDDNDNDNDNDNDEGSRKRKAGRTKKKKRRKSNASKTVHVVS